MRRNRLWANLIALEVDGVVEIGVATFPALDEVYWGIRGLGAWRCHGSRTEQLHHSAITDVRKSVLCVNRMQDGLVVPYSKKLLDFMSQFWAVRSLGGPWTPCLSAQGRRRVARTHL